MHEPSVKTTNEKINSRLYPNRSDNHPAAGRIVAIESIYPVNIHSALFIEAPSVPMITGNPVFTTVESSTAIKVVSITLNNTSHL